MAAAGRIVAHFTPPFLRGAKAGCEIFSLRRKGGETNRRLMPMTSGRLTKQHLKDRSFRVLFVFS